MLAPISAPSMTIPHKWQMAMDRPYSEIQRPRNEAAGSKTKS
jgi:hypothetical protein